MTESIPPTPESSTPPVASAAAPAAIETTGLAPNIAAGLACLFSLVGGIIFLVLEKRSQFVRYWAMQSVFLGGLWFALSVFFQIAGFILGHLPFIGGLFGMLSWVLSGALFLVIFVVYVITVIKSFSNQE